jgi:hypothetical protein
MGDVISEAGGVSNVEVDKSKVSQIKGIGGIISTFETLPWKASGAWSAISQVGSHTTLS